MLWVIDYHLHVWPHAPGTPAPTPDVLELYSTTAQQRGLSRIAITEHSHRFIQVDAAVGHFWDADPNHLSAATSKIWNEEQGADLDAYCDALLLAQADGLPIELGIEVDLLPDRADEMATVIAQYPFDVRLGSVHWLGSWLFDAYGTEVFIAEWERRGIESAWRDYERAMQELVDADLCDVIAHCDLIKVAGRLPDAGMRADFEDRLVALLTASGLAVEVSSAGWRKLADEQYPSRRILEGLADACVPITLASDAHVPEQIAWEYERLIALVLDVGFRSVAIFEGGNRALIDLVPADPH